MKCRLLAAATALCVAGCAGTPEPPAPARPAPAPEAAPTPSPAPSSAPAPAPIWRAKVLHNRYDGVTDDLLTGGLGKTGLGQAIPPALSDPTKPKSVELRRRAIYTNYRALADMTTAGGYGVLYGPNIDLAGRDTLGEGKIAGDEFVTYVDGATLMVQVPERFNPKDPCIVTATSSGSRGIYGAIGTSGEWGLKRGCAVAYTDKGTGSGIHDLATDTVSVVTGERASAALAGENSLFTAAMTPEQRTRYLRDYPHRVAVKHAHSQVNPEKDWGRHTLAAVEFAFHVLNGLADRRAGRYAPENTLVIASSISNGAYGALAAAEQDTRGLIDALALSEPNVSLADVRSTLDTSTLLNLYLPCASLAESNRFAPFNTVPQPLREARCASLAKKGLLRSANLAQQAAESQRIINDYGILPEANQVLPSHYTLSVMQGVAVTYANSYGRFSVLDNLCGYSFAASTSSGVDAGEPVAATGLENSFALSNGIPPTAGINLINNLSPGGAKEDRLSVSPSTGARDLNVDGALCLRSLATGVDPVTGRALEGELAEQARRVQRGIEETRLTGNLRGRPAVIVNGRADAVLPANYASRAYYARNKVVEPGSRLYYYEVTHAHHLDALNGLAGFDSRFLPLNVYFTRALNLMWDHLKGGQALPPSQVVRTRTREVKEGRATPISLANLPPIERLPAANARIAVDPEGRLRIPD
jgi:hydroxybutyrate-dimer hydrolase